MGEFPLILMGIVSSPLACKVKLQLLFQQGNGYFNRSEELISHLF